MSGSAWSLEVASQMLGYDSFADVPQNEWDAVMELADEIDD